MDFLENPFYLLGATTRDDRRRIVELAEEKSLMGNSVECAQARSDLTNPRKRLSAEISWLPGVAPRRVSEAISLDGRNPGHLKSLTNLPTLATANLLAAGLERLDSDVSGNEMAEWILNLSFLHEEIEPEGVLILINEDRTISGFPEVSDLSLVETELSERRQYFLRAIKQALGRLLPTERVKTITFVVESATNYGERHAPILIDDLVDSYEVDAQSFLEKETEKVNALIAQIENSADSHQPENELSELVLKLEMVAKNWDLFAQPIQVSARSRGLDHDLSHTVAASIRGLALHLFNEHGKLELSQRLTGLLREVFAEVDEIVELSEEDSCTLEDIAEQRLKYLRQTEAQAEEWRRKITYETEVGLVFKKKLKISPAGIEWQDRHWDLAEVTRVRWGYTTTYVHGNPTGTKYNIFFFGSRTGGGLIETKKENVYTQFVDRLWKAVGPRLITEFLEGLRDGKRFRFGSVMVDDLGIEIVKQRVFRANQVIHCPWNNIAIWNAPGVFCIAQKDQRQLSAKLSYQDDDNVHILEAAMRAFWQRSGDRLSSLLG